MYSTRFLRKVILPNTTVCTSYDFSYTNLPAKEMNRILAELPKVSSGTIQFTGIPEVHAVDISVATTKGWTVLT